MVAVEGQNDGKKGEVSKICKATSRIRDHNGFTGNVRKAEALQIGNKENSVTNIDGSGSASLSADPVFKPKYDATVDIRSLKKTEGVSERLMIWRKNSLAMNALR